MEWLQKAAQALHIGMEVLAITDASASPASFEVTISGEKFEVTVAPKV